MRNKMKIDMERLLNSVLDEMGLSGDTVDLDSFKSHLDEISFDEDGISIEEMCDMVKNRVIKKNQIYVVNGMQSPIGIFPSTEIVYDVFEGISADTYVSVIGPIANDGNRPLFRHRYFAEGHRIELKEIYPEDKRMGNYIEILKTSGGQNA